MARYYTQYTIYDWDDDIPLPTRYTTIGGVQVRSQFASTSFYNGDSSGPIGFNYVRFVGITPVSEVESSEFGVSWDDVGTTYYEYQSINIPDGNYIDPQYLISGTYGADGSELAFGWSGSTGTAETSWGSLSLSVNPGISLSTAYDYAVDYAARSSPVLANLVNAVNRAGTLKDALESSMQASVDLLSYGVENFETMSAGEFAARADMLFRDTQETYLRALEDSLGTQPGASTLLRTVNILGDFASGQADIEVGYSTEAPVAGGLIMLGVDVQAYVGSGARDVVLTVADPEGSVLNRVYDLGAGHDVFVGSDNPGEIFLGGAGDDDAVMGGGVDLAEGGSGNDRLDGGAGNDLLFGDAGNDYLAGGAGDDEMDGGAGNDFYVVGSTGDQVIESLTYSAGGGIDTVRSYVNYVQPENIEIVRLSTLTGSVNLTATGNDAPGTLVGNAGANGLNGRGGNDQLNGNDGNDRLIGGVGRDTLVGGAGADTFVYLSVSESRAGSANRDVINGFARGADVIDLGAVDAVQTSWGDDAFAFIGHAAFSGQAGELRLQSLGGANAILVEADVNGDAVADMQLFVNLTTTLGAGDFIL